MTERPEPVDEHVVFFTTALGDPAAERYPTLRAAVGRVESLCNDEEVRDAKVFRLVAVPLSVTPYFRVEVDDAPSLDAEPREVRAVPDPRGAEALRDERRPMRAMREETPRPRADTEAPVDEPAEAPDAPAPAAGTAAGTEAGTGTETGRSLGFFVR